MNKLNSESLSSNETQIRYIYVQIHKIVMSIITSDLFYSPGHALELFNEI